VDLFAAVASSSEPDPLPRYARVAVALPVDRALHYRVPDHLVGRVLFGSRVKVRVSGRATFGTVVGLDRTPEVARVLDVDDVVEPSARVSDELVDLCRFVADRYGASLGETLESVLPPPLRRGQGLRKVVVLRLADELAHDAARVKAEMAALDAKHGKQARVLRLLAEAGGEANLFELRRRAVVGDSPIESLERRGLVVRERREETSDARLLAPPRGESRPPPRLTVAQQQAVDAITLAVRSRAPLGFLLFGVTGSGKTEVYLKALEATVAQGRRAIVLVPEISLTPQTVARFRARFDRVAVLHSALAERDRLREWRRVEAGGVDVVVGARSALFAPMPDLGLIVVDEEHEPSFKQQNPPRYHARDVAVERARRLGAVCVLGSATPSLESWVAASEGRLVRLDLPERVGGGELPPTIVVDLAALPFKNPPRLLSDRLRAAIGDVLKKRQQAILFLNRRGFSRVAWCPSCRGSIRCRQCDVTLVLHRRSERLICHLCGHEEPPTDVCPACGAKPLRFLGFGTERVEQELHATFPGARVARMDSDTTAAIGSHERILGEFARGDVDLLVGTQMIAKGLDFPNVTLVGIVSADTSLSVPDWRASERTFQLVAQVAGRAGRSARGGFVVVQTIHPDHAAIRCAVKHDYEAFAAGELELRREAGYPPATEIVRILVSHPDLERTRAAAAKVREKLAPMAGEFAVELLGPAPCPIERARGRFRWHLLLKCRNVRELTKVVVWARERVVQSGPVRVTLDVDPASLL
jgi:primosomal protein N' (replication factor Y)